MQVLLVLQILVVVGLVAVILVQKTSSDGFTGASSPSAFLTGRAQANLFTRITAILATIFLVNSLVLAYIASHTERGLKIFNEIKKEQSSKTSEATAKDESSTKAENEVKLDNNINDTQLISGVKKPEIEDSAVKLEGAEISKESEQADKKIPAKVKSEAKPDNSKAKNKSTTVPISE